MVWITLGAVSAKSAVVCHLVCSSGVCEADQLPGGATKTRLLRCVLCSPSAYTKSLDVAHGCAPEAHLAVEELLDVLQRHALRLRDVRGDEHPEEAEEAEDEERGELDGVKHHWGELSDDEVADPIRHRRDAQRAGTAPHREDLGAIDLCRVRRGARQMPGRHQPI